jgi:predicted nucleotidyltransferase
MILPEMGTTSEQGPFSGLAAALFTPVQQRVLGLLFAQPNRRFRSSEIIRLAGSGTGAVHRQLQRLEASGLVEASREGNQKHYQARRDSPIFEELHGLAVKTFGIADPLRVALAPFADRIVAAFVFGSVAKAADRAGSDVDLLVVSDELAYPDLFSALATAEVTLARSVNPTILTTAEWHRERSRDDSFVARISGQPRIFVTGDADALG